MSVGVFWERQRKDQNGTYLSVQLDDPSFAAPVWARLFPAKDENGGEKAGEYVMLWDRPRT